MKKKLLLLIIALPTIISLGFSQNYREWTNGPGTTSWNSTNWNGSTIAFGQLEWKGGGNVSSVNDAGNPYSSWRFYFSGSKAYTLSGNTVNLFDNSTAFSWVLNDATAAQNLNLPINFADAGARYSYITNRSTGSLTFGSGNNVGITGSITALRIAGNNTSAHITFNGTISGSRPIDIGKDGSDADQVNTRVVFNGNNASYSGVTTLYAGTLTIPANSALGSGSLILGNSISATSTLAVTTSTLRSQGIQINNTSSASVIDVASGQTFELSGVLSGGATNTTKFGKSGSGTLTLSGTATYNGQIQIGDGSVIANNNTAISTNVSTSVRGVDLGFNVGDVSTANNVSLLANNGFTVSNSIYVSSNANSSTRTIGLNGSGSATFSNEIYLDGNLTVSGGSGIVTLGGRLTNTGGIIASAGIVNLTASNNNFTGTSTVNSGAELRLNPAASATYSSPIILNGGTLSTTGITATRTFTSSSTLNLSASIASTIALGTGNHTLTFANSSGFTPWGVGATLTITGWGGTAGATNTNGGKIFVGIGGLTSHQLAKITFSGYTGTPIILGSGELVPQSPQITYSSTQFTTARNITRGTTQLPIYGFRVFVTNANTTLNSLTFTTPTDAPLTSSTYTNADITNFRPYLTTSATFNANTPLAVSRPSAKEQANLGETGIEFLSLNRTLNVSQEYYIWLAADILNAATSGDKIIVNAPTVGITGSVTGTNSATGIQTIIAGTPVTYYLRANDASTSSNWAINQIGAYGATLPALTASDVNLIVDDETAATIGDLPLGPNSTLTVSTGSAATLTVTGTISSSTTVNVGSAGVLNINAATNPTLGTLAAGSTIGYGLAGNQEIVAIDYTNLTIDGSGNKTLAGATTVSGVLTPTAGTLVTGGNLTLTSTTISGGGAVAAGAGVVSGNVTVQRYSQPQRGYRTFGHPFSTAQNLGLLTDDFRITGLTTATGSGTYATSAGNVSAFLYDPTQVAGSTSVLTRLYDATADVWTRGRGLYVFVRGAGNEGMNGTGAANYSGGHTAVTIDGTGTINQGDVPVNLGYTVGMDNYNLIGNPYPCPINLKAVTGMSSFGTVYVYNPTKNVSGADQYTLAGGFDQYTNNGTNNIIVPAFGAFYIQATGNGQSLTFRESDKAVGGTPDFTMFGTINQPKLRLAIANAKGTIDEMTLGISSGSSDASTDKYDAAKLGNSLFNFYSIASDKKSLAIDYRANLNSTIPLGVQTGLNNNYTISLSELTDLPNTQVVLRDKLLNKETILSQVGDSYSFAITADTATKGENRFEIGLLATTVLPVQIADITAQLQANKTVSVNWTSTTEVNLANYKVQRSKDGSNFSTVGTVAAKGASAYSYSDDLNNAGILPATINYRLEALDKDGSKTYSRVVAVAFGSNLAKAAINIYPNPVQSTLFAQVTVTKASSAQLKVVDAQGKIVATQKTQLAVGTTSISIPAAQLAAGSYTLEIETTDGKQQQRFVKE